MDSKKEIGVSDLVLIDEISFCRLQSEESDHKKKNGAEIPPQN